MSLPETANTVLVQKEGGEETRRNWVLQATCQGGTMYVIVQENFAEKLGPAPKPGSVAWKWGHDQSTVVHAASKLDSALRVLLTSPSTLALLCGEG